MRRHAAPGTPDLRHFCQRLGVRPLAQAEGDTRRFLDRQIAGRKRIGVTEAEQQVNVGGPRPNSMQRGERRVCLIGVHVSDCGEIDAAFSHRFADLPDRFDLRGREAEPFEFVGASPSYRIVMKRIEGGEQPGANCGGAGS